MVGATDPVGEGERSVDARATTVLKKSLVGSLCGVGLRGLVIVRLGLGCGDRTTA